MKPLLDLRTDRRVRLEAFEPVPNGRYIARRKLTPDDIIDAAKRLVGCDLAQAYGAPDGEPDHAEVDPTEAMRTLEDFLRFHFDTKDEEAFVACFFTPTGALITIEEISEGGLVEVLLYLRPLVRRCLSLGAAQLILSHNHTSGCADPSPSDLKITAELSAFLRRIDVTLCDHLIVGAGTGRVHSMREAGQLGDKPRPKLLAAAED